jgi:hypothetical protein
MGAELVACSLRSPLACDGTPIRRGGTSTILVVTNRYRCSACGNLTRFDVVVQRRTREFHHFSVAGELTIEDEEKLAETMERVTCRWCSATGDAIEEIPAAIEPAIEAPSS